MKRLFLHYDQAGLDEAYEQAAYASNMALVLKRYASSSDVARSRIGEPQRHAYGPTAIETLDVYATGKRGAPVFIFLHGGAWRAGAARNYAFAAETFVRAGAHMVIPDFVPVQEANGDVGVMVEQTRRAVAWTYRNAERFGGDPDRIYVGGHSSGAHLAGMCLVSDWPSLGVPEGCIKGGLCSSGVYDLRPIRLSARNSYIRLTDASEQALSVFRHATRVRVPVLVTHGTEESPEFVRQAREFADAINGSGGCASLVSGQFFNHFEILETLGSPHGVLGHAMLHLMKLAGPLPHGQ